MSYANCARTPKLTLAPPLPALIWRNLFVRRTRHLLPSCSLFFWTETILEIGSRSSTEDVKTKPIVCCPEKPGIPQVKHPFNLLTALT